MTKEEFLNLVNARIGQEGDRIAMISDEDYRVIETVYAFHPSIDNVSGKVQIADLYVTYGMSIIWDMHRRAGFLEANEQKLLNLRNKISELEKQIDSVRKGGSLPGLF